MALGCKSLHFLFLHIGLQVLLAGETILCCYAHFWLASLSLLTVIPPLPTTQADLIKARSSSSSKACKRTWVWASMMLWPPSCDGAEGGNEPPSWDFPWILWKNCSLWAKDGYLWKLDQFSSSHWREAGFPWSQHRGKAKETSDGKSWIPTNII